MKMNISFDIDGTMNILDQVILDLAVHYTNINNIPIKHIRKDKYDIAEALGIPIHDAIEFIESIDYSKIPLREDFLEVYHKRFKGNKRYNINIITARNPNAKLLFIDANGKEVHRTTRELSIAQLKRAGIDYSNIWFTHNKSKAMLTNDIKLHVDDCVEVIKDIRANDLKVIPVKTRYIGEIQDHFSSWHDIADEIDAFYEGGNWR